MLWVWHTRMNRLTSSEPRTSSMHTSCMRRFVSKLPGAILTPTLGVRVAKAAQNSPMKKPANYNRHLHWSIIAVRIRTIFLQCNDIA